MLSSVKNQPSWLIHSKTKLTWFPGRDIEFKGKGSPSSSNYSPK